MSFQFTKLALCMSMTAALVLTSSALAQQNTTAQNQTDKTTYDSAVRPASGQLGRIDEYTGANTVRLSELIGMNIENSSGEGVGEIHDLVADSKSMKIRYAAVTYGGFLGMGNKLFAVPIEAFEVKQDPDDPNDPDDVVLILNVSEDQLEGAQGFDQENWPDFADKNFTSELDRRYKVDRDRMNNRTRDGVNVGVNRDGVNVDVDRNRETE